MKFNSIPNTTRAIRKEGGKIMNRDEGQYPLTCLYDSLLGATSPSGGKLVDISVWRWLQNYKQLKLSLMCKIKQLCIRNFYLLSIPTEWMLLSIIIYIILV